MTNKEQVLANYLDPDLQITVDKNPGKWTSGNGLMHTGFFYSLCAALDQVTPEDKERFKQCVELCEDPEGLYDRNQGRDDKNAHDDACGVVAASAMLGCRFHTDVLDHGRANMFIYNNTDDRKFITGLDPRQWQWWSFRARFPFEIVWYYLVNKKATILKPVLFLQLLLNKPKDYHAILSFMRYVSTFKPNRLFWTSERKANLIAAVKEYFKPEHPINGMVEELCSRY